jgi:hypothetical protein
MYRSSCGFPRAAALLVALSATVAHAVDSDADGTWITFAQSQGDERIEQQLIATESAVVLRDAEGARVGLYNADADELLLFSATDRKISRVTRSTADSLASTLRQQLERLEEEIAEMSPERAKLTRLRMRQLFSQGEKQAFPQPDALVSTGEAGEQAGIGCTVYTMMAADAITGRVCFADADALEHGSSILGMLRLVSYFHATLREVDPAYIDMIMPGTPLLSLPEGSGIPLLIELLAEDGEALRRLEVVKAWSAGVPAALVEPPARRDIIDVGEAGSDR